MLNARCWLGSFFRTMVEAGIPTTIFSSAEKQTAWNYNLEIRHKFKAENNFAPYKEASYWPYVIRRYFFLFITIGLLIYQNKLNRILADSVEAIWAPGSLPGVPE